MCCFITDNSSKQMMSQTIKVVTGKGKEEGG